MVNINKNKIKKKYINLKFFKEYYNKRFFYIPNIFIKKLNKN